MASPFKERLKAIIRNYIQTELSTQAPPSYSMGSCTQVNDDGTINVQDQNGNVWTATPKYPVVLGQNVVLANAGGGVLSAIPLGPRTPPEQIIHPPYFTGGGKHMFFGLVGTAPGSYVDSQLDIFLQISGSNRIIAIRARDILTPEDYASALIAGRAGNNTVIYAVSPDHKSLLLIYPMNVSSVNTPSAAVLLNIQGIGPGEELDSTLGVYALNTVNAVQYQTGIDFTLGAGGNVVSLDVFGASCNNSGLGYFLILLPSGMMGIASLAPGATALSVISEINFFGNVASFCGPICGSFLNPAEGNLLIAYNTATITNSPNGTHQEFLLVIDSENVSSPIGGVVPIVDPVETLDTSGAYNVPFWYQANFSFPPCYLPSNTSGALSGGELTQFNNLWASVQGSNSSLFWAGLWKYDGSNGVSFVIRNTALLIRLMATDSPYMITPVDGSFQAFSPAITVYNNSYLIYPSSQYINPVQMSVSGGTVYTVDYSLNQITPGSPPVINYCYPKVYALKGDIGSTLTKPSDATPYLTNVSPGFVDPDAIRLFATSVDGTGMYSYLSSAQKMDMFFA